MSFTRKLQKRLTLDTYMLEDNKKLPALNHAQFSTRFNALLDRVSVQNRYATRISHTNMKNLKELEVARDQLKRIAEQKKMQELKASDNNELIEQIKVRVKDSETELEVVFKEVVAAKKQIKHLKCIIVDLENDNLNLEKQVLQAKRQRLNEVCLARKEVQQDLLTTHLGSYLVDSMNTNSILYKFCCQAHKTGDFTSFFKRLDEKIEKQLKLTERSSHRSGSKQYSSNVKLKLPVSKLFAEDRKGLKRYKTQHSNTIDPQSHKHF